MNLMSLGGSFRLDIQIFEAKMQRKTTEFLKPHSPWLSPCPAPKWLLQGQKWVGKKCQRPKIANVKRSPKKLLDFKVFLAGKIQVFILEGDYET